MVFCSKCGSENNDSEIYCKDCNSLLIKENYLKIGKYENFEDIFDEKNYKILKNNELTPYAYRCILKNISDMGHYYLKELYEELPKQKLMNLSILEKIAYLTMAYAKINYKSKGAELGSYAFNLINVDDRLDSANQISTMIHELAHHLLSEIFEQILMYLWRTEKSDAIEAYVFYTLVGNPAVKLMNEYCAHTVEGRFVPHGYQNYGSFNNLIMQEFDMENEKEMGAIIMNLILGNSFAHDITDILEEFIDFDLREEIKEQFKRDFTYPPQYDGIIFEKHEELNIKSKLDAAMTILKAGYEAAKEEDMREVLDQFRENYSEINKD